MSIATKIIQYNTNGATFSVQKQLVVTTVSTGYVNIEAGGATDHGALTGLGDDDHAQYHNDARGDARYYTKTQSDALLSGKFDEPTGDTTQYVAGDGSLVSFPVAGQAGTLVRQVRNETGSTLTKGTVIYISGASGNKSTVSKAIATSDATSAQTFGIIQADILNNQNGYAVVKGDLVGIDTSSFTDGAQLYLSGVTAGTYTTIKPVAPIHMVYVGVVTRSHATQGQIEVSIQNGYELDEIHDVLITSKTNKDVLSYDSVSGLWKNKQLLSTDISDFKAASRPTYGESTVSLGVTPTNEAELVVTGQTGIAAGAKVQAQIGLTATTDYTVKDHKYLGSLGVSVTTGNVVAGTGFTIFIRSSQKLTGDISIAWLY